MKKFFTLLLILFICNHANVFAQATCNPAFAIQYLTANTVKFNPDIVSDSPAVQHLWTFGTTPQTSSSQISPTHTYSAGVYYVIHRVYRYNPNGVLVCSDSTYHTVTVQGPCELNASFTVQPSTPNLNTFYFNNTSTNAQTSDSIRWTFGDGSSSNTYNATHQYAAPGVYNVCLRIKKLNSVTGATPCVSEVCHTVTVNAPCNTAATFTSSPTTTSPNTIHFTNTTAGINPADTIQWNFGDNSTSSLNDPTHTFNGPGTYQVCLIIHHAVPAGSAPCISYVCHAVTIPPVACNLAVHFTSALVPPSTNTVHFTNTSTGYASTDTIRWIFGDGSSSFDNNPNHTYTTSGTYQACLIITHPTNPGVPTCVNYECHSISVTVPNECNIVAAYTSHPDSANPSTIHFTNNSTGYTAADSITWTFGDGSISHDINPNHTYTSPGTYHVCLIIKKATTLGTTTCIRESCHDVVVTAPCTLVAGFTSQQSSSATNLTVYFTNTSTPVNSSDSIRWTFGDGTSSGGLNSYHIYAQPGTYTVCLRVQKRVNGQLQPCVREICHSVTVIAPCNITPHFTVTSDAINPRKKIFTNTTVAPSASTATWYFGDNTSASTWNAIHEYANAGRYYVCLRIQYNNCVTYSCDSVTVTLPPPTCAQLSNYHYQAQSNTSNQFTFTPNSIATDVVYTWTFGDGTGSHDVPATHTYAAPGYYTVCLTAFRNATCASTSCNSVYVAAPVPACQNILSNFNVAHDSLMPNRITFTATANATITDQLWTITKMPTTAGTGVTTIHSNNPTYVFIDIGYYNVCLRASFAGGCIKETCRIIHIEHGIPTSSTCSLQAVPNPVTTSVSVNLALTSPLMMNAYIYNSANMVVGQKQQQGFVGSNTISMNTSALAAGIYSIRVIYGNTSCATTFVKL